MRKQAKSGWGWTFIIIGFISLGIGGIMLYIYFDMKATLIDESNPESFWSALGLIFTYASVGSYILLMGLGASAVGIILITIGIMVLRS
jgi:hypothetical protein